MKQKKGMISLALLAKYIILIASFFVILGVLASLLGILEDKSVEQACRSSVAARANTKINLGIGGTEINLIPVQCQTQNLNIPEGKTTRLTDEQVRDRVQKEIADAMAMCWWMFGNGYYSDVFGDKGGNDNLCHVCYSFVIDSSLKGTEEEPGPLHKPILIDDFKNYLMTHNYDQGILQGDVNVIAESARLTFNSPYPEEEKPEPLSMKRILSSQSRLQQGVADFAGIYADYPKAIQKIRTEDMVQFYSETISLEPIIVIIPSLPDKTVDENENVALDILNEWQIGSEQLNNGLVFVFVLDKGVMFYAAASGADAVLPLSIITDVYDDTVYPAMNAGKPQEAIASFFHALLDKVLKMNQDNNIVETLKFQRSYYGYLTGGATGSKTTNDEVKSQGAIAVQDGKGDENKETINSLKPGERYAIVFISPDGGGLFAAREVPNLIGLGIHEDLVNSKNEAICNEHTKK